MDQFIAASLVELRRALASTLGRANLHLRPATITRTLAARVRSELKALETILRRLIILLALGLTLTPVKPRNLLRPLPDGAILLDIQLPRGAKKRLNFLGRKCEVFSDTPLWPSTSPAGPRPPASLTLLFAHARALFSVIKSPIPHARRIARALEKIKASGEDYPYIPEQRARHRLAPALGLLAGVLPELIRKAWRGPDTS